MVSLTGRLSAQEPVPWRDPSPHGVQFVTVDDNIKLEVLVLRELEGLSYREIAEVADIPLGTVMSSLSRARARIRILLIHHPNKPSSRRLAAFSHERQAE